MKSKIQNCPHCHQAIVVRARRIHPAWLKAMRQLQKSMRPLKVSELSGLNRSTLADFTKLKYWGLIAPYENNKWHATTLGNDFLSGAVSLPKYKWVFNDEVQPDPNDRENPEIFASDIEPEIQTDPIYKRGVSLGEYRKLHQMTDLFQGLRFA